MIKNVARPIDQQKLGRADINNQYETIKNIVSILLGCSIIVLLAVCLANRKEDMRTELMNYELKLVEKKISEFQDKSIQQLKKEESNEK